MEYRLSLNEVIRKSSQALRGLNFPYGSNIENGKNIGWLEARSLPGLQSLFEEIQAPAKTSSQLPLKINTQGDTVHLSNPSAFYLAQSAVDLAECGKIVKILKCKYPLLLLAEMARRTHLPFGFEIKWHKEGNVNSGLSHGGNTLTNFQSKELQVACCLELVRLKKLDFATSTNLADSRRTLRKDGIICEGHKWEIICTTANKIFVPESAQSRTSAGAEVDDSN